MAHYLYGGITEQHKAALKRGIDAKKLMEQKRWRGAMYLAGYIAECHLKERLMEKYDVSHLDQLEEILKRKFGDVKAAEHSIEKLFNWLNTADPTGGNRAAYNKCKEWNVNWRYRPDDGREDECKKFFEHVKTFAAFVLNHT